MSLKYLNLTGLSRVITNLKNWVVSQIPTKTSEITNDSGFLTSHQSLSNYVTLNSNQTLTSTKTFTTNINTTSTATSQRETWRLIFNKDSADTDSTTAAQLGVVQVANSHDFYAILRLANPRANNKPTTENTKNCWSGIGVFYNYDENRGRPYAQNCWDWPASSNSSYELASTSWVRTYCETTKGFLTSHQSLSNYVTLNSAQTISGAKTFTANVNVPALYGTSASFSYGLDTGCIEMNASQGRSDGGYIDFHYNQSTADFTSRIIENESGQLDINGIKFRSDASYLGVSIEGATVDLNDLYSTIKGATRIYYATTNGGTNNITNKPVGQAFTLYSHTVRRQSASDYVIEQLAYGGTTIYFRSCTNGTWTAWKTFSFSDHTHSQYLTSHQSLANYVTLNSDQTISSSKRFAAQQYRYNTSYDAGQNTSTTDFGFTWVDKDLEAVAWINRCHWSNNYSGLSLGTSNKYTNNALATNGTAVHSYIEICTTPTGVPYLNTNAKWWCSVSPASNNAVDLGDTSHHWRSLYIGEVHCYNGNAVMMKNGSYTFLLRNDGSNIWFLISEANGNEGTWSGLRPLYINCATGACTSSSKWTFDKSFGDGDPSVLIQSGTAYANGTWNYPLSALAPNMKAGSNLFMPIGRNHSTGNCAGWHFYYAGNNSNDNFLSVEFYAAGSPLSVYRDGRVFLSATPATSDNSTRVATTAYVKNQGYLSGTVPIANGGTGSTTRLGAVQNLTNEHVGTNTQYFLTITQNWGKAGYCSVADAKTVLGIGTTSKKLTLIGERETEGTWTLTCTTLAPIYFKIVASKTSSTAEFVCGLSSTSSCRFVTDSNSYNSTQIVYTVIKTGSSGEAMWGIGIPTSSSSSVTVFIRNSQYMQTFNIKAYQ